MPRSADALINPQMLIWARRNTGYSIEEAATKVIVSIEKYSNWERGESRPTIAQLRKLANIFKRPLAVFYLQEIPRDFQPLRDYRRIAPIEGDEFLASPQLRIEIRKARYRRDIAHELFELLGEVPQEFDFTTDLLANPEDTADNLRRYLGITMDYQSQWTTDYEALNSWRTAIESTGVLVFQAQGVDIEEMRGFSIGNGVLPIIVVNIKDSPRARIFSMIHELTHISLNAAGICDFSESSRLNKYAEQTEIFCNMVAGATIVPFQALLSINIVKNADALYEWSDEELRYLSRYFEASWETILRRLLIAGKTSHNFYDHKRREFEEFYRNLPKKKEGFAPPSTRAVSSAGPSFVRLVLDGYYQEKITGSELSELLEVRLKHMPKIESAVFSRVIEFDSIS